MAHARAKLTVLGRRLLVDRVEIDGWKPADAAKAMGVSRQTAYKWLRRFHDEGSAGLLDRTSAPRRCPHRLAPDAVATIVATRLETLYGPHRLAYALGRPRSTIYGVLRRERISASASSTGRPAPWCVMSGTGPASSSTLTSRNWGGSERAEAGRSAGETWAPQGR